MIRKTIGHQVISLSKLNSRCSQKEVCIMPRKQWCPNPFTVVFAENTNFLPPTLYILAAIITRGRVRMIQDRTSKSLHLFFLICSGARYPNVLNGQLATGEHIMWSPLLGRSRPSLSSSSFTRDVISPSTAVSLGLVLPAPSHTSVWWLTPN